MSSVALPTIIIFQSSPYSISLSDDLPTLTITITDMTINITARCLATTPPCPPWSLSMPHPGGNGELASEVMVEELLGHYDASRPVKLVHGASLLALVHLQIHLSKMLKEGFNHHLEVVKPGGLIGLGGKQLHSGARCPAHFPLACEAAKCLVIKVSGLQSIW